MNADAATETRTLVIERDMPHPPEKVWRALTQGPLLEDWLMQNDFEPRVGKKFNFRTNPMPQWNGVVDCEVLELEENQRLSYRWDVGEGGGGLKTIVTFTLTPIESGTHLRMEQSGFGPGQERNYQGAAYGWQKFLGGLERVLGGLA
jgi:uncharacterized protein YndB with AHSA1/START domain